MQAGLTAATAGDEVWVVAGVYTPGATVSDTFQLLDDVAVYGGFADGETTLEERDWENNLTVLSGDIGGDDAADAGGVMTDTDNINGPNSYHVVVGSGVTTTAVLDGFVLTAGRTVSDTALTLGCVDNECGGGMLIAGGSPTLANLMFSGNLARAGGGLATVSFSNLTLTNISFLDNVSIVSGGGLYHVNSSTHLTRVLFSRICATHGGGMYTGGGSVTFSNVTFTRNNSTYEGGGLFASSANTTLSNVTFSSNSASLRGGAYTLTAAI